MKSECNFDIGMYTQLRNCENFRDIVSYDHFKSQLKLQWVGFFQMHEN